MNSRSKTRERIEEAQRRDESIERQSSYSSPPRSKSPCRCSNTG